MDRPAAARGRPRGRSPHRAPDPEHGPVASGDARHREVRDRARRRDGRRSRRAGRLPAPRLREGVRERLLVPVHPVHGSPQLQLRDPRQPRLLHGGGEAAPARDARALPVAARDGGRAVAARRPPHALRRRVPRAPGDDAVPLRHRGARAHLGPPGDAVRRARHLELHPHRRREARHAAELPARGARDDREDPHAAARLRRDRHAEPHLRRPPQGHRHALEGGLHPLRRHRPGAARGRRSARRAQGRAVPDVRRGRLRRAGRRGRRQLRPLPGLRRGDAPEPAHRGAVPGEAREPRAGPGERGRPARALAGEGPRLQPDGRADPAVQVGDRGAARAGGRGLRRDRVARTASSASTWSRTARPCRSRCAAARRASSTPRRCR